MRAKLTILFCAVLVLALGASQANAQAGGYDVLRGIPDVAQHGKNQEVGIIRLDFDATGGIIDAGSDLTITFGGLPIAVNGEAACTNGVSCTSADDLTLNDDKDTLTLETDGTPTGNAQTITLTGVRVDVSSLEAGDEVMATISTSAPSGLIPVGQSRRGTVATAVATVRAGLTVGVTAASRLICNLDAMEDHDNNPDTPMIPVGGIPMITLTEGFDDAWEVDAIGDTDTNITIAVLNLPEGVELRWPASVEFQNPADDDNTVWATLTLTGDGATEAVVDETSDEANDGSMVTYAYSTQVAAEAMDVPDVFEIPITVVTGDISSGGGGIADIWGILSPQPSDDDADIGTVLSYAKDPVTDPMTVEGDFLNIAECVTYLLFPYLTCGSDDEWTTAIAIANTTMDDGVFGLSAGATPQAGNIMLHMFPRTMMGDDGMAMMDENGMMMMMGHSGATELTDSLAAGDTYSDTCSNVAPGFEGYAIAKAGFRQAHGLAFVLGMFDGGARIDVAHGYLALVIPDPEFGGDRAPAEGESLGQ